MLGSGTYWAISSVDMYWLKRSALILGSGNYEVISSVDMYWLKRSAMILGEWEL